MSPAHAACPWPCLQSLCHVTLKPGAQDPLRPLQVGIWGRAGEGGSSRLPGARTPAAKTPVMGATRRLTLSIPWMHAGPSSGTRGTCRWLGFRAAWWPQWSDAHTAPKPPGAATPAKQEPATASWDMVS